MFSAKELHLEEAELREQVRNLSADQRERYEELERKLLKNPETYLRLNWLFLVGAHHVYLQRWVRAVLSLALTLAGLFLIVGLQHPWYGLLALAALQVIEIPQLLNAHHLVHAYNNRVMQRCLSRV